MGWRQICSLTYHGIEKHISHFPLLSLLKEGCWFFSFKLQRIRNCNNSWILKKVHFPCSDFTLCSATDVNSYRFKHVIWWKNFYYIRTSRNIVYRKATISFEKSDIVSPIYKDPCLRNPVWKKMLSIKSSITQQHFVHYFKTWAILQLGSGLIKKKAKVELSLKQPQLCMLIR